MNTVTPELLSLSSDATDMNAKAQSPIQFIQGMRFQWSLRSIAFFAVAVLSLAGPIALCGEAPAPDAETAKKPEVAKETEKAKDPSEDKGENAEEGEDKKETGPNVGSALYLDYPESEEPLYELLLNAFKESKDNESLKFLQGRKPVDFTARAAAFRALEDNLGVQLAAHNDEAAQQALREARALLLPVFSVGFNTKTLETYRRKRTQFVEKRILDPVANPSFTPFPPFAPPSKISEIVLLGFNKEVVPGVEFASEPSQKVPDNIQTLSVSIDQQLPWGGSVSVSTNLIRRKRFQSRKFPRSFRLPWTSTFLTDYFFPLPFTKNFGPYSAVDTQIKISQVNMKRADWDFRTVINSTLLTTDLTFWEMVNRILAIESTRQNRVMVQELLKQTEILLASQRATVFEKSQLESELARVQNLEAQAWNAYILVSDSLVELLDLPDDLVLIPRGYSPLLAERMEFTHEDAVPLGLENRPELKSAQLQKDFTAIIEKNSGMLERPEVFITGSVSLKQDNTKVGYTTAMNSLKQMFNEDNNTHNHTIGFNRPLFNRAERARHEQSKLSDQAQGLQVRITENQVEEEVNGALSDLESATRTLEESKSSVDASKKAYDFAVELRKIGRITEFEMISRSQAWLSADLTHIQAQVNYKQAEARLLGAQGLIAYLYPERTAPNEFDKFRLSLLRHAKIRNFFGTSDSDEKTTKTEVAPTAPQKDAEKEGAQ